MKTIISRHKFLFLILNFVLAFAFVIPGYAQQGLKLVIESVEVGSFPTVDAYLSISNLQGLPISGLTNADFTVSERGTPVTEFEVNAVQNLQQPLTFVLVMDTSGSMQGKALSDSIAAAKRFVENTGDHDQIGVISFADEVTIVQEPVSEKAVVQASLDTLTAGGNTVMYDALYEGVQLLKDVPHRKVIILVADGVDSQISTHPIQEVIQEALLLGIPIGSIGFGNVDAEELVMIARSTGGLAQIQPDTSTLDMTFNRVLELLRQQYLLRYQSSIPEDGMEHDLTVTVQFQETPYTATASFMPQPADVRITLPDYSHGQSVGGKVHFAPVISFPAPIAKMDISLDGVLLDSVLTEPFEYDWDTNSVSPGSHEFLFSIEDTAGNFDEFSINLFVESTVSVRIDVPADGNQVSGPTPIKASVESGAAIATVVFLLDDTLIDTRSSPPFETYLSAEDIDHGDHQIIVIATDTLGNYAQDQIRVNFRPPIFLSITSPQAGVQLRGNVMIDLEADALYGIQQIIIEVNGEAIATLTDPPWEAKWPLYFVEPGSHRISALAVDQNGHYAETDVLVEVQSLSLLWWAVLILALLLAGITLTVVIRRRRSRLV